VTENRSDSLIGKFPVILTYGPYAKGLAFQDGYPSAWQRMVQKHPDVTAGSTNKYQNWEVADPEKWVPHDYACVRVDSRGCGPFLHDDPHDRPREIFGGVTTLHFARTMPNYVLLPIIPEKQERNPSEKTSRVGKGGQGIAVLARRSLRRAHAAFPTTV
jgi:hypothetical protein